MDADDWCVVSRSGSTASVTSLSEISLIIKQGYLLKKAENLKTWRRRYFILFSDGNLLGFESKPHKSYQNYNNKFIAKNCQIIQVDTPKPFVFIVRLRDQNKKIIERNFCGSSNDDRQLWCDAFMSINHNQKSEECQIDKADLSNFVSIEHISKQRTSVSNLEDFQIIKQVGRGTFGRVMLVKKKGEFFAMKIIPKKLIYNSKEMEHLLMERRVLAESSSRHPFLTSLEFAFQTNTHLYMVMEYAGAV